jgi:WD40 repeat protein
MTHGTGNECLATFSLPKALTAICMDGEDRCIFVGSCDGEIYEMNINGAPAVEMGGHLHDMENDDEDEEGNGKGDENNKKSSKRRKKNESFTTYRGHNRAIVSLHCTADGYHLLSTSEDGMCRLWDRASGKCVKIVKHPRADAPIASACVAFRNHVEKVIANVGEGGSSSLLVSSSNENTTNADGTSRLSKAVSAEPPDATARAPLGTFERYGSVYGGVLETNGETTVKTTTTPPPPWDGPLVTL